MPVVPSCYFTKQPTIDKHGVMALLRRLAIPLAVFLGLGLIVYAGFRSAARPSDIRVTGNVAIDALIPSAGAEILSQDRVGVDLADGWQGSLSVNGRLIPSNEIEADSGLNLIVFQPGPGKKIERLDTTNCAEIVFWRILEGPDTAPPAIRWCFSAT